MTWCEFVDAGCNKSSLLKTQIKSARIDNHPGYEENLLKTFAYNCEKNYLSCEIRQEKLKLEAKV